MCSLYYLKTFSPDSMFAKKETTKISIYMVTPTEIEKTRINKTYSWLEASKMPQPVKVLAMKAGDLLQGVPSAQWMERPDFYKFSLDLYTYTMAWVQPHPQWVNEEE